ncbi:MAG: penicillin-binding transpeptidase domain-containing protein, partial [Actinomycetota bacterium]
MTEPKTGLRIKVLVALVAVLFAALTTRLWFLQVLAAEQYQAAAEDNAVRLIETPAVRGVIKDTTGKVLVANRVSVVITVNRQDLGDETERVLYDLSTLLGVPADELGSRLDDTNYYAFSPIPIAIDVPKRVAYYIKERVREFPGVDVLEVPVRDYAFGSLGAHVLGYLGSIGEDELATPAFAGYDPDDRIGVAGVEGVYERDLAGTPGLKKYRVNSLDENLGLIGEQDPVAGNDVWLTIDADIQGLVEESLVAGIEYAQGVFDSDSGRNLAANAAAAIVLDPTTGEIEAMASYPSFAPSFWTRSHSKSELKRLFGPANGSPLLNRAIQGQYPPGSTYKPFVAL